MPGAPEGATAPASGGDDPPRRQGEHPRRRSVSVARAIQAANRIHRRTYIWGGGHRSFKAKGYDCSGAVSYVLHAAGVLSFPLVSGQLAFWGVPGPGKLDHGLRQQDAHLHDDRRSALRHLAARRDGQPGSRPALALHAADRDRLRGPALSPASSQPPRNSCGSSVSTCSQLGEPLLGLPREQTPNLVPARAERERGNQAVGANPPDRGGGAGSFRASPSANPVGRRRRTVCGQNTQQQQQEAGAGRAAVGRVARRRGAGDGPDRRDRLAAAASPTTPTAPSGTAQLQPDGTALPPANAPRPVRKAIAAANRIHTRPYIWGGGHRALQVQGLRLLRRGQLRAACRRAAPEPDGLRAADVLGLPGHRLSGSPSMPTAPTPG